MKKIFALMLALLALCAPGRAAKLMVVSDLHYLAPELYKGSDLFLRALRAGDGKLTQRGEDLMAALCAQAARERPDALIVTGDLSFNGERASHEALARWFSRIEAGGVPVWVIPGNHDINVATPRGFSRDGWYAVEGASPEAFCAIYADFMGTPDGGAGLSYLACVDGGLCVAMTDVAFYEGGAQTFGLFTAGHAAFLERAAARAGDSALLTATHHSLVAHTEFMADSYLMFGSEAMRAAAKRLGVRLNLSGHLHAQHIAAADGVTDAATGAFCAWPHRYAVAEVADGAIEYEARALDADLLPDGFADMSREWYYGIARDRTLAALADADPADAEAMADFAARFNMAYFSGARRPDDAWTDDPAYAMWMERDDAMAGYLRQVMGEEAGEMTRVRIGD